MSEQEDASQTTRDGEKSPPAEECIFCAIARHELPAKVRYEDSLLIAIDDLNPAAPTHLLVITKEHFPSLTAMDDPAAWAAFLPAVQKLAAEETLGQGYRLVINTGKDGGQTVGHLHMHFLAGRKFSWPPG